MKRLRYLLPAILYMLLFGCEAMDDNYRQYLDEERVYSPKIENLKAYEGLREVSLTWDNPAGDLAKKIFIDYGTDSLLFNEMIDSVHIEGLDIIGYTVSVYTLDAYDNKSVPETISIFPNGEN